LKAALFYDTFIISKATWLEVHATFLHDIASAIVKDEIPDEPILNVDQTPSKFVPTDNVTMAEKSSKHIQKRKGRIPTLDPFTP